VLVSGGQGERGTGARDTSSLSLSLEDGQQLALLHTGSCSEHHKDLPRVSRDSSLTRECSGSPGLPLGAAVHRLQGQRVSLCSGCMQHQRLLLPHQAGLMRRVEVPGAR